MQKITVISKTLSSLVMIFLSFWSSAQIVSGPMLGNVTLRTSSIWVETVPGTKLSLKLLNQSLQSEVGIEIEEKEIYNFHYTIFDFYGLQPGTRYNYVLTAVSDNGKEVENGSFNTLELWQFHKPAPDITFLTGSCLYVNEPEYDRPGKPYGRDPKIMEQMAKIPSDACFWLGDNWYYREVDYDSEYGLYYRPHHDRAIPEMKELLRAMPHYAMWDDHDYGPNNSNLSYILKDKSRDVFQTYWLNPSYGENGQGIYTKVSISDVDFYILDNRWFRNEDDISNDNKPYLGQQQLTWLKNDIKTSHATFKVLLTGSQALNEESDFESYIKFKDERNEFFNFLKNESISGVLFLSGDRHHSSVIKNEKILDYTLYDVTVSPFTSGGYPFSGKELNPPNRILGIAELQNFAKVQVTGERKSREFHVDFIGLDGKVIDSWSVNEKELQAKKK